MAWICITVLQRCSGSLTECKKLGAQEQRGVGLQKREKAEAGWEGGGGGGYWDQYRACTRERAGWRGLMRNKARRCKVMWREVG